jgi:hypothetical protein
MNDDNNNIIQLVSKSTNTTVEADMATPVHDYAIYDIGGLTHLATGFLLFTSHHVAVMRETPHGALPVFMLPLTELRFVKLTENNEEDAPF